MVDPLLAGIVCGTAMYLYTYLCVAPTYRSYFTAYINNKTTFDNTYVSGSDISASRSLTTTYAQIIKSRPILQKAVEKLGPEYSLGQFSVSVSVLDNTELIVVSVISTDPQAVYAYAKALEEVLPESMEEIIQGSTMSIISPSLEPAGRFAPNYRQKAMTGFLAGLVTAALIIALLFLLDNHVKSPDMLIGQFEIPIIGVIHDKYTEKGGRSHLLKSQSWNLQASTAEGILTEPLSDSAGKDSMEQMRF